MTKMILRNWFALMSEPPNHSLLGFSGRARGTAGPTSHLRVQLRQDAGRRKPTTKDRVSSWEEKQLNRTTNTEQGSRKRTFLNQPPPSFWSAAHVMPQSDHPLNPAKTYIAHKKKNVFHQEQRERERTSAESQCPPPAKHSLTRCRCMFFLAVFHRKGTNLDKGETKIQDKTTDRVNSEQQQAQSTLSNNRCFLMQVIAIEFNRSSQPSLVMVL